jgi:hypothetical protein
MRTDNTFGWTIKETNTKEPKTRPIFDKILKYKAI